MEANLNIHHSFILKNSQMGTSEWVQWWQDLGLILCEMKEELQYLKDN